MNEVGGGVIDIKESPNWKDLNPLGDILIDDAIFDASQYAFFGKDVVEEDELGGLGEGLPPLELEDEEFFNRKEDEDITSDIDDLTSTFFKLNRNVSGPKGTGIIGEQRSRENSSLSELALREDTLKWFDQHVFDPDTTQQGKRWSLQPHLSLGQLQETKPLYRTSSYPERQSWAQKDEIPNWLDQHVLDPKTSVEGKRWLFHPHSSFAQLQEIKPLYRTSSYPEQQNWAQREDIPNQFDPETPHEGRRRLSLPQPSDAQLQKLKHLYRTSSYPEQQYWAQREDFPNWFDPEIPQEMKRRLSLPQSSDAQLQKLKHLHRTSSYPEQQVWAQPEDFLNYFDQYMFERELPHEGRRWSSLSQLQKSKPLDRTSSYPEKWQQQLHHHQQFSSEPVLVPKSSFTSFPPPGLRSQQASLCRNMGHLNFPHNVAESILQMSLSNVSCLSGSQMSGGSHESPFGGNMPMLSPSVANRAKGQWINQPGLHGDHADLLSNMLQQQLTLHNGSIPPHLVAQLQQQLRSQYGHKHIQQLAGYNPAFHNPHFRPGSSFTRKYEKMLEMTDVRNQRPKSAQRGKQHPCLFPQSSDISSQKDNGSLQFRSKHMTSDEIESILKIQLAASNNNDPYVDDYYHQACLAKKSSGSKLKHRLCPRHLKESSSRSRANTELHASHQVEALGRVLFTSIRRPRPLLEVDTLNSSVTSSTQEKVSEKPLEMEPLFAARVMIEDCLSLLLEVEDLDRFLQFNHFQDGGNQLKQKRQGLLEGLAASLQLVDPLGKNRHNVGLSAKDDQVFLRIVSIGKGQKFLARFLQILLPGCDLMRIVCMAIFRHLRFLFGGMPSDPAAAETTNNLAKVVSSCVHEMSLGALGACLAAVVCSSELPPLRPLGSSAGDGASIILLSVLQRATEHLTGHHATNSYNTTNRSLWQASFDEFFGLLTKYCVNKYDSIMQSLLSQSITEINVIGSDAAKAINREMPVELLRASLPHTNENQRRLLLDFVQRSVPVVGPHGNAGSNGGHVNSNCAELVGSLN